MCARARTHTHINTHTHTLSEVSFWNAASEGLGNVAGAEEWTVYGAGAQLWAV